MKEFDSVRLTRPMRGLDEDGQPADFAAGAGGAIVMVCGGGAAFEVEFFDAEGWTCGLFAVPADVLEVVWEAP